MTRRPGRILLPIVLLAGIVAWAIWLRRPPSAPVAGKMSGAELLERHRREQEAALTEDDRRRREIMDRPRAPGDRLDIDHLTALSDAERERLQELHARTQAAVRAVEERRAARSGQAAAVQESAAGTPEPRNQEQEEAAARLRLRLETSPGPHVLFRPLAVRLSLENPGPSAVDLRQTLTPRLDAIVFDVQGPGQSEWRMLHLVQDTSSSGWSPRVVPMQPGVTHVLHTEIPAGWSPAFQDLKEGSYRLRATFRSVDQNRARPSAEVRIDAVSPQGQDLALLRSLIERKAVGLLGVRSPDWGGLGATPWADWVEWAMKQPPSPILRDLQTGLLALLGPQLPPGPLSDSHRALARRLLDGVPDPAGWPYAERLLLKAGVAQRIGEPALAEAWRQAFARTCPGDVRLSSGR